MMKPEDEILAVKAAKLYFEEEKTQEEVARILMLTRWKVGRLLARAKAQGIVRIEIVHPQARRLSVERSVREKFGLSDAVVVPSHPEESESEIRMRVAAAAAEYLTALRPAVRILGLSWGRTLQDVANALKVGWGVKVHVVQINGGVSVNKQSSHAVTTALAIATRASGTATLLPSPTILQDASIKNAIMSDCNVAAVLDAAKSADTYLYSAGTVDLNSVLVESGYISPDEIKTLVDKGAVGDVVGRFIDAEGAIVDRALDLRTVGIEIGDLKLAPRAIAVIAGRSKHGVCHAVVTAGLCSVLITDEVTARHLLGDAGGKSEPREIL